LDGRIATRVGLRQALSKCASQFRRPFPKVTLWMGVRPLTVPHSDGTVDVYLEAGSDLHQLKLQSAHEAFHATFNGKIHWTHEVLATHFSVRHLQWTGEMSYATSVKDYFATEACAVSTATILRGDWPQFPKEAHFGRAYVLGQHLIRAATWNRLKDLATTDVESWMKSLDGRISKRVSRLLSPAAASDA